MVAAVLEQLLQGLPLFDLNHQARQTARLFVRHTKCDGLGHVGMLKRNLLDFGG